MIDRLAAVWLAALLVQAAPPGSCFPASALVSDLNTRWFCGQIAAAGLHRLEGSTAYRLVYLPSFRSAKIVEVRRERTAWIIQTTILSGIGGGPPGTIRERRQRWLTDDDVRDLVATIDRSGVWGPDTQAMSNVVDDSTIVVEAVQADTHRVHVATSQAMAGRPLADLVDLLRAMAGIDDLER